MVKDLGPLPQHLRAILQGQNKLSLIVQMLAVLKLDTTKANLYNFGEWPIAQSFVHVQPRFCRAMLRQEADILLNDAGVISKSKSHC